MILTTKGFEDYQLVDSGEKMRLEKWGDYLLARPDPQAIWKKRKDNSVWQKADAVFVKKGNREEWRRKGNTKSEWTVSYKNLTLKAKLTPFKHTGVFPEQSIQWEWIREIIEDAKRETHVLNLFAYTGVASLIAAAAGARVTHVDASRPSLGWARENQALSHLQDKPIRYILDDAIKFITREVRRGVKYDGILMDPPVYGHGPQGEIWDFQKDLPHLIDLCKQVLSENPLFMIINGYAISASSLMLHNMLEDTFGNQGTIESGELALEEETGRLLSTGIFGRWKSN